MLRGVPDAAVLGAAGGLNPLVPFVPGPDRRLAAEPGEDVVLGAGLVPEEPADWVTVLIGLFQKVFVGEALQGHLDDGIVQLQSLGDGISGGHAVSCQLG